MCLNIRSSLCVYVLTMLSCVLTISVAKSQAAARFLQDLSDALPGNSSYFISLSALPLSVSVAVNRAQPAESCNCIYCTARFVIQCAYVFVGLLQEIAIISKQK